MESSVEELFDRYADDLYRFAFHATGNREDSSDIVQDVFLRAIHAWPSFRGDASARTWLYQIARNRVRDWHRKRRVRNDHDRDRQHVEEAVAAPADPPIELERALSGLKTGYREVLSLRFVQDLSVSDTARILGWTEAKVRTTQHRALNALRLKLVDAMDEGGVSRGNQ